MLIGACQEPPLEVNAVVGQPLPDAIEFIEGNETTAPNGVSAIAYVASNTFAVDQVMAVQVGSDGTARLTVSAGGPTIPQTELPASMFHLLDVGLPDRDEAELVLVVQTSAGPAYKVDALLFGDCVTVEEAFRTFADPQYEKICLTEEGVIHR